MLPDTPTMKLLLVDDEEEICLLLSAMLAQFGIASVTAHSVTDAEAHFAQGPFHGVFLDVNLPDGKGYDLIPALRRSSPGARVIVISAMDQERESALDAGADLFLAKPLDRRAVLEGLSSIHLLNPDPPSETHGLHQDPAGR
jgi:two-component system OmpR family response regulator